MAARRPTSKKVTAYVTSIPNGVVQIGNTRFQPATGNRWKVKDKPWLKNDRALYDENIIKVRTSGKSMGGAEQALSDAYKKLY